MRLTFRDNRLFNLNPLCIYMLVRADNKQYKERFMKLKDDELMTHHGLFSFHAIDVSDPGPYGYMGMSKYSDAYNEVSQIDILAQSEFGDNYAQYSAMKISCTHIGTFEEQMVDFVSNQVMQLENSCYSALDILLKDQRIKTAIDKLIDKRYGKEDSDILKSAFTSERLEEALKRYSSACYFDWYTEKARSLLTDDFLIDLLKFVTKLLSPDIQKSNAEIRSFFRKREKYTPDCLLDDRGEMLPEPQGEIVIKRVMVGNEEGHDIVLRIDGEEIRLDNMSKREKLYYAFVCLMSPEGVRGYGLWKPMKYHNIVATRLFTERWKRIADSYADDIRCAYGPQAVSNINRAIKMAVGDKDHPAFYEISRDDDRHYVKMPRERIDTADFVKTEFL